MWEKLNTILTRWEKKGFKIANKAHQYTVNMLLLAFGYGAYTIFNDYNDMFREARDLDEEDFLAELEE